MQLSYDPGIAFLGIYPKEIRFNVHTKACTQLFTAAIFIIAPNQGQPR